MRQDEIVDRRQRFPAGATVDGIVTKRATFGVFIDLAPGVDGLLELSYMSIDPTSYGHGDPYAVGSKIRARVLAVYENDGQIRLTQRASPTTGG